MAVINIGSIQSVLNKFERNPLEVAGFTSLLLDTGINDDTVLWKMVRRFLQTAISEIHPDKTGNELSEKQRELMEAFEILKDYENFRIALKELRTAQSHRRSDENLLKRDAIQRQKRLSELEKQLSRGHLLGEELKTKLGLHNLQVIGNLAMPSVNIRESPHTKRANFQTISGVRQATTIFTIRMSLDFGEELWTEADHQVMKEKFDQLMLLKKRIPKEEFFEKRSFFWGEFRKTNFTSAKSWDLLNLAIRRTSRANLPVVRWNEADAVELHGFKSLGGYSSDRAMSNFAKGYPQLLQTIKESVGDFVLFRIKYERALSRIRESVLANNRIVSRLNLYPEVLSVKDGMLGGSRILGSVMPEGLKFKPVAKPKHVTTPFTGGLSYETVVDNFHPLLASGAYLLVDSDSNDICYEGSLDDESIRRKLIHNYQTKLYKFSTYRMIVAVM